MDVGEQPKFVTSLWLVLGIITLIGNTLATVIVWLRKVNREKSKFGLKFHAAYNLLGIDVAYSFVGLTLTITSLVRLAKGGSISAATCEIWGFFSTLCFHFAAVGVFVSQLDKLYCLLKPFAYHAYSRRKSSVPYIVFTCCASYGIVIAVLSLTNQGGYASKTSCTNCLPVWNQNGAFKTVLAFNIILLALIVFVVLANLREKLKLVQKRREMRVATSHKNETIIFVLTMSSLFAVCWSPNLVAMFVSAFLQKDQLEDKTKAVLFGISLIPLLFNPVVTFCFRPDCRHELIRRCNCFKKCFMPKRIKKHLGQLQSVTRVGCIVAIEMERIR